jgi:hypothetical protein
MTVYCFSKLQLAIAAFYIPLANLVEQRFLCGPDVLRKHNRSTFVPVDQPAPGCARNTAEV